MASARVSLWFLSAIVVVVPVSSSSSIIRCPLVVVLTSFTIPIICISFTSFFPIRFIGIGEKIDDLQPFSAQQFVDALFS